MALFDATSPLTPFNATNAGVIPNEVYGVSINWFVNRTPLYARLPKAPVGSLQFLLTNDNFRPRSFVLTASFADTSGTVLTVADSSVFEPGDVVEVESERFLVTAIASATTATVTRGYAGSTAATHSNSLTGYLLGNTRTGAEINVAGNSRVPTTVTQNIQTVQHAYSVGGSLQTATDYVSGFASPLDRDRMIAMQHVVDDFEESCVYGVGVALASGTTRPMMKGLRTLIATNNTTLPTNAAAYKPQDLIRDTVQKCYDNGGNPDVIFASTDFLTGLGVWGQAVQRIPSGENIYGTPIEVFQLPFVDGVRFIPHPLLRPGTAICLSSPEVGLRIKRTMFDKPRGSRGDAVEGDLIMEGAVALLNEAHHAWVSGITGFAAA